MSVSDRVFFIETHYHKRDMFDGTPNTLEMP
jgi:hypothetical protein